MKVFISWSGATSKKIAEALRSWLPSVLQAVKPYYSPDDITKGSRWSSEIAAELDESKIGLVCLTAENLSAPWVLFEAGALSKSVSAARVCPLLFGVEPSDVTGPLVQFQAAPFSMDEMKKVMKMMNDELGASALASDVLDSVFEMWWPKLEASVRSATASRARTVKEVVRSDRDILDEILARLRAQKTMEAGPRVSPMAVDDLMTHYRRLRSEVENLPTSVRSGLLGMVEDLERPVIHIADRLERQWLAQQEVSVSGASYRRLLSDDALPSVSNQQEATEPTLRRAPRLHRTPK